MKFYFSGVNTAEIRDILILAGVTNYLADPVDFPFLPTELHYSLALDSGAYRAFKKGQQVDVQDYQQFITNLTRPLDFCVAPDVIGDAQETFKRWQEMRKSGFNTIPVWHYKADRRILHHYLSQSQLVGIGGLVMPMREKHEDVLEAVSNLCAEFPGRFHLFGLNWLKAMTVLQETCASMDTSKFLDSARYGHVLFVNTKTGKLSQCPAKAIPELKDLTRQQRLTLSASNMRKYFDGILIDSPFGM